MKTHLERTACGIAAMAAGWWAAGFLPTVSPGTTEETAEPAPSPRFAAAGPTHTTPPRTSAITWSPSTVPLEELEGLHTLRLSPALKLQSFIGGTHLFLGSPPAAPLAGWLDLTPEDIHSLHQVLSDAADARISWESAHMRNERIAPGHYRLKWCEPGPEVRNAFQRELSERFGDTLARSIWLRGSLDRFAEPVPGWERRGVEEIDIHITPRPDGRFIVRTTNGDWNDVRTVQVQSGEIPVPRRLRHLFELRTDSEEMRELVATVPQSAVPFAAPAGEGMVFSPFNGKLIDVRGIPPGTLVVDPTYPAEEKAFFLTPPEE